MFAFLCVAGYFAVNRYVVTSQLRDFKHQEAANSVDDNQNASGTSQSAPIHLISDEMVAACSGSEAKVLKAMQANRAKCPARAAVTWTLLNTRTADDGTAQEFLGKFEQWWDGNRIATRNSLQVPGNNPDGTIETTIIGHRSAFDGKEFRTTVNEPKPEGIATRRMPEYKLGASWLTLIDWEQGPDFARVRANPVAQVTWTEEIREGNPFAQRLAVNTSDGASLVDLFDLERGGERVETTSRDPKGRTYATSSYRLEQLDGGAWFPVEIDEQSFHPDTGKIQNRNQYQIQRSDSAFGGKAQIDKGVFELPPWKDLIPAYYSQLSSAYRQSRVSSNIIRAAGGTVSWTGDSLFRDATFPSIGIVDLQNCKLTDEMYAALAKIPDHFVLMIDSNIFDQHTMRKLAEIEYLSGLFLEPGPVAERAVKDFQKQRPDIMVTVGFLSESGSREYPRRND